MSDAERIVAEALASESAGIDPEFFGEAAPDMARAAVVALRGAGWIDARNPTDEQARALQARINEYGCYVPIAEVRAAFRAAAEQAQHEEKR